VSYKFATVYSVLLSSAVSSISISLIFSGVLRLISVIRKSEAAGLQLLGSDYIALNKIRLVSVTFSFIFPCLLIFFFNAHPGYFPLFYESESTSFFQDVENNWAVALYLVLPFSTTVVNAIAKIYSDFTKENIDRRVNGFTIYGSKQCNSEAKVILSL
jgi:ABC-type dipeptide/oligopeptide/nickel transport system permease component